MNTVDNQATTSAAPTLEKTNTNTLKEDQNNISDKVNHLTNRYRLEAISSINANNKKSNTPLIMKQ